MKRKFLVVFMAIVTAFCMAFGMVGCGEKSDETGNNPPVVDPSGGEQGGEQGGSQGGGEQGGIQEPDEGEEGNTPAPHVHSYGEWKVTKESTCKETGTKEHSCACGEKETETLPLAGHDFENMTCKWCGIQASLGLEYTLINEDKEYEVSGIGDCKDTDLIITNNYNGKPVTAIGKDAFSDCSRLTSVTIPDSVTSIGENAFEDCGTINEVYISDLAAWCGIMFGNLDANPINFALFLNGEEITKLEIPDSVTEIGDYAFVLCRRLTSVTIPDSVTSIGDYAFGDCWGLTSVATGNGVTSIGDCAFAGCSELTSVTIGNGVTSIGIAAFYDCSGLTSVTIGSGVTSIGNDAFYGCSGLQSVIWNAENCIEVDSPFRNCTNISSVTFREKVKTIPSGMFSNCNWLKTIVIPDSVTSIGDWAFWDCSGLTSITIPNSVISIGKEAFERCSGLTSVTIPDSVTSIGDYAFWNCSKLKEVHFENQNGWKISLNEDMSGAEAVSGLDNPATAAQYLTDTYRNYYWEREE